jgi:hypothetical protein
MAGSSRQIAPLAVGFIAAAWFFHSALGQQRSPSNGPLIPVVGTVKAVSGNTISVEAGAHVTNIITDEHTEIWKGKTFHDLSPVQTGDDFSARCRADASGKLVAELIWLNIVNFFGVITKADGDSFEMLSNPNADLQSAYVKKTLKVSVDADTVFDSSAKEDLKVGREVQMVGLDLKAGRILATRLTVYEGNRPVRMGNWKVMPVTGPPK